MAQVEVSSGKDVSGRIMYADFGSGGGGASQSNGGSAQTVISDTRFAARVVNIAGVTPGYSVIHVPMKRFGAGYWDESASQVALRKGGMGKIKARMRARMYYKDSGGKVVLQVGSVVKIPHMIGVDGGQVIVFDDKWLLSKVTSFGRMCYDTIFGNQYFDAGMPCTFNLDGWGDCLDTNYGPRFAPSRRFGYKAQYDTEDTTEPEPGKATTRARKWRISDCLRYMRDMHYIGCPFTRISYGTRTINNKFVSWPEMLINSVASTRVVNNLSCENVTLALALDRVIKKAGPYELYMEPGAGFASVLTAVSMNPTDSAGVALRLPDYQTADVGSMMNDPESIKDGYIEESIVDYFDDVCICGDPVAIERELSMNPSGNQLTLEAAWDSADETLFKSYVADNGNSKQAFQAATKIWPLVYCAYRLQSGAKIWENTKWADMVGNIQPYARFRAYLLSGYQQSATNPRNTMARDVIVEYYDGSNWQAAERYDFFSLAPDGQFFMLQALRDKDDPQTWYNTGNLYAGATLTKRNIRLTIPIEADWRITGIAGGSDNPDNSADVGDPNQTAERIENNGDGFTYLSVAEALDYVEHLRFDAHPNGVGGVGGITAAVDSFDDKCTEGNELFTDRINEREGRIYEHAKERLKDVKRVQYGGQIVLATFNPSIKPGDAVSIAGGNDVIAVSTCIKTVIHDAMVQGTIVECGALDRAGIFDIPKGGAKYTDGSLTQQPAAASEVAASKASGYVSDEDEIGGNNRGRYK